MGKDTGSLLLHFDGHLKHGTAWTAQELTPRAQASLVSFGERLSTRLFAAYLRTRGVPARQHDAFDLGAPSP